MKIPVSIIFLLFFLSPISSYGDINLESNIVGNSDEIQKIKLFLKKSIGPSYEYLVEQTEIKEIYSASFGMQVIYLTADLKFVFKGDIYNTFNGENITFAIKQKLRATAFASLDKTTMISFLPKESLTEKNSIYVFTDIDCGYCRKFHDEVDELNKMGINVHYLAFPRAGQKGSTFEKMVSVWCSSERNEALSTAKKGKKISKITCENPINEHYELGVEIGLKGTPAVYSEDGTVLGGFVSAKDMKNFLESKNTR